MITVFRVYKAVAEMKYTIKKGVQHKPILNRETVSEALVNDPDPVLVKVFDNKADAEAFVRERYPVIQIDPPAGIALKFIRVSGYYVEEDDIELDEDGGIADVNSVGTWYVSEFPADYDPD